MGTYIKSESHDEYVKFQIDTNKRKLNNIWITDDTINKIVRWIKDANINVKSGVCHGVRNGYEVQEFRKLLGNGIFGTDISDTATQFKNVVEWDFHNIKDEWISKFDFIYSNSWDHSYDFELCFTQWMKTLSSTGACFLEWSADLNRPHNKADCFGIEKDSLIKYIQEDYQVSDVFEVRGQVGRNGPDKRDVIVIQHTGD